MSGGDGPPIRFYGDDFPYWKICIKAYLEVIDIGVYMATTQGFPEPRDPTNLAGEEFNYEKWNAKTKNTHFRSLCKDVFNRVRNHRNAHDLWMEICVVHDGTKSEREEIYHIAMKKLNYFQMLANENANDMYSRLNILVEEVNGLGLTQISQPDVVRKILSVLPIYTTLYDGRVGVHLKSGEGSHASARLSAVSPHALPERKPRLSLDGNHRGDLTPPPHSPWKETHAAQPQIVMVTSALAHALGSPWKETHDLLGRKPMLARPQIAVVTSANQGICYPWKGIDMMALSSLPFGLCIVSGEEATSEAMRGCLGRSASKEPRFSVRHHRTRDPTMEFHPLP
jgi:hypothetical protein